MSTSLNENKKPLLIGLTGGIGCGKSTVAKIFKSSGIPVFNSDVEAKIIINNDEEVINQVILMFGKVYNEGKLDTQKMAGVVFNDKNALEKLNNIIHPKVAECFDLWVKKNSETPILIKEAAILIESGAYLQMDKIIVVTAPEELRIKRVIERDDVSKEKVVERIRSQLSDKEKLIYADFIIINDGVDMLIPQILKTLEEIKKP